MHQNSTKNQPKINQKSTKIDQNLTPGASWKALGGLWGAILVPRGTKIPYKTTAAKLRSLIWMLFGAKIHPKSLLDRSWKLIGYRARKMIPKVIQNPPKIYSKSIQKSVQTYINILVPLGMIFY